MIDDTLRCSSWQITIWIPRGRAVVMIQIMVEYLRSAIAGDRPAVTMNRRGQSKQPTSPDRGW